MRRVISLVSFIGAGTLLAAACGDDADVINTGRAGSAGTGGSGGRQSFGGSGGRQSFGGSGPVGTAGTGGTRAAGAGGGSVVDVDAGDAGGEAPDASGVLVDAGDAGTCNTAADCGDDPCLTEACVGGVCQRTPLVIGTDCGSSSADECTAPDTCDGYGVCLTNDQPPGSTCGAGHCNATGVCDCAVERVTAVPYGQPWQTTADTETDSLDECQTCNGTRDHIVVFTAPAAGTYRFEATSIGGDVELALYPGDCNASPSGATCGIDDPESGFDTIDVALEAGAVVTVAVGENCEENGSEGNLSIELVPDDG